MDLEIIIEMYMILFVMQVALVQGKTVLTKFEKISGNGKLDLACARDARDRGVVATMTDTSGVCTGLDWSWGSAPSYVSGSTYFEKKHVVEIYQTPMVLGGEMWLPVMFTAGAYIDMQIEFTKDDFSYGAIQLVDTLNGTVTRMIYLSMTPLQGGIMIKTYQAGWINQADITPYPFPAGSTHTLTLKSLNTQTQVLIDDVEVAKYTHVAPPEEARMLTFADVGMLLHQIDFVGV